MIRILMIVFRALFGITMMMIIHSRSQDVSAREQGLRKRPAGALPTSETLDRGVRPVAERLLRCRADLQAELRAAVRFLL